MTTTIAISDSSGATVAINDTAPTVRLTDEPVGIVQLHHTALTDLALGDASDG